jgi:ABC-type sugar transport system ATPase subunit
MAVTRFRSRHLSIYTGLISNQSSPSCEKPTPREEKVAALLRVTGLRKSFRGVAALRDGQFELEAGTVHALCGGNGAGKSTFLSIVMGIYRRDGGQFGEMAARSSSIARRRR